MKTYLSKNLGLLLILLFLSLIGEAQTCTFSLGNDTSICQGIPINFNLSAPTGATAYLWDNATTVSTRHITNYGTYYCKLTQNGTNVVANGNFNLGNTGFTSSYIQGPTGSTWGIVGDPGTYAITTNASLVHSNFPSFTNHTAGGGKMMVINGASVPNVSVWCQNIVVTPNTNYNFSTWVCSCENVTQLANLASLQFSINGNVIGIPFSPNTVFGSWTQFNATWNSTTNTNASICIVNQNTAAAGNDFAIDDIFFQPVCVYTDTLKVTSKPFPTGYNAGIDATICKGTNAVINATNGDGTNFSWTSDPAGFSSSSLNLIVSPLDTTKYILISDLNGCKKRDTVVVNVIPTPSPNAGVDETICDGESVTLIGNAGGGAVFSWSSLPPGYASSLISPTLNPLNTSKYILLSQNGTCVARDTVEVTVNTSPIADFDVFPLDSSCNSYTVSFVNNSSNSLSYAWDFGDGELSNDPLPIHMFTGQNIYQVKLIAKNAGCEDVKILPLKISFSENTLFVPSSFTPNNDTKNDSFSIPKGCLKSVSVIIYDRWGQIAKQWDGLNGSWDGKINGIPAAEGVYVYLLDGVFLSGEKARKKGSITLFR